MNEQQLAECEAEDVRERERFAVGSLVYLRRAGFSRWHTEPLSGQLVEPTGPERELCETASGWIWREPLGHLVHRPHRFRVTAIEPGRQVDCGSDAGLGYWGARYTLVCLDNDVFTPLSPVPASQLVLLEEIPVPVPVAG